MLDERVIIIIVRKRKEMRDVWVGVEEEEEKVEGWWFLVWFEKWFSLCVGGGVM